MASIADPPYLLLLAPSALVDGSMGVCEFSSLQPALTHTTWVDFARPTGCSTLRKKNENEIELELDIAFVG